MTADRQSLADDVFIVHLADGKLCAFGVESTARAYAGKTGRVDRVPLRRPPVALAAPRDAAPTMKVHELLRGVPIRKAGMVPPASDVVLMADIQGRVSATDTIDATTPTQTLTSAARRADLQMVSRAIYALATSAATAPPETCESIAPPPFPPMPDHCEEWMSDDLWNYACLVGYRVAIDTLPAAPPDLARRIDALREHLQRLGMDLT